MKHPQSFGTILRSTTVDVTRLVVTDGGVTLQTLTIAHEVTLTPGEVGTMLTALAQEPTLYQDPVLQRLLAEETGAPVVITAALRGYPAPGTVCACEAQPSVHVVNGACSPFLREEA